MCNVIKNIRMPDIYFRHNGQIDITVSVVKSLDIKEGDTINVWKNDDEYYLYAIHNDNSVPGRRKAICRPTKKGTNFMRANCKQLTDYITSLTNAREAHLFVGQLVELEPIGKALPLIVSNNKYLYN